MATANITREEAVLRSGVVKAGAYRVTVDVTGNGVADPERTFASHTELDSKKSHSSFPICPILTEWPLESLRHCRADEKPVLERSVRFI